MGRLAPIAPPSFRTPTLLMMEPKVCCPTNANSSLTRSHGSATRPNAGSRRRGLSKNSKPASLCDHDGQKLAYVYFEDEPGRRSAAKLLSKDEARRIGRYFAE